jgi:hypothetical protein
MRPIESHHIEEKSVVGKNTRNGTPVVYIKTHGGLHCFFANMDGVIRCVGAAPHKAIAKFLAEKRFPGFFKWSEK